MFGMLVIVVGWPGVYPYHQCISLVASVNSGGWTGYMYTVSQKNCAKFFLLDLRQNSTNFDNFWQKDGKEAKIMRGALIFNLI